MKVLLTGHLGYIGTVLTPMLLQRGHEVLGLDSDLFAGCTFGQPIVEIPALIKDVRDVRQEDLKGFDAVLHLAGLSNDPLGDLDPHLTYEINYRASVRLAELSKRAGVRRFVFSSSCSNYGAAGDDMLDEQAAFNPVTPYGESKAMVERDVAAMADDGFSPTFLRNATAYGISPRLRFDLVLNNLVAWAFTTGQIMMKSDGNSWRPVVHVEDVCEAFIAVLNAPRELVHNEAFNVGRTEENFRVRDLAQIVAGAVPHCRVAFAADACPDRRSYRVNCDKIQRTLKGFCPRWTAANGAQQLCQAYGKTSLTVEEFEGPTYQRIGHVRKLLSTGVLDSELRYRSPAVGHGRPKRRT